MSSTSEHTTGKTGVSAAIKAAAYIRQRVGAGWQDPVAGIVLGSGLGGLADRIEHAVRIPFSRVTRGSCSTGRSQDAPW